MSEEVCLYNKFGFCKFKESCRRYHCKETCKEEKCKDKNICRKRHPRKCKKFLSEKGCRFGDDCSYKHLSPIQLPKEKDDLAVKVELLTSVVEKMAKKINLLETEVSELKKTSSDEVGTTVELDDISSKTTLPEYTTEKANVKEGIKVLSETKEVPNDENATEFQVGESDGEPPIKKDTEKQEMGNEMFHCKKCAYQCKKEVTLMKHVNTKHTQQKCKVCNLEFNTSLEVLKHIADEHKSSYDETRNKSEKRKDEKQEEAEDVAIEIEDGKFKCSLCMKIVPNEDTFDNPKGNNQNMCQFCTMVSQYG